MGDKSPKAKDRAKKQANDTKGQKANDAQTKAAANNRAAAPKK